MIAITRIFLSLFVCFCLASCAPSRADLSKHALPDKEKPCIVMVKRVDYDAHGLPLFHSRLHKQPEKAGEQYTLAYFTKDRPVKSFDIVIGKHKFDTGRPLNVLYTWTGKGFEVGVVLGEMTIRGAHGARDKEALLVLAVGAAMPLAGGIAGFAIGTLAIIPQGLQDLGKTLFTGKEAIISFAEYEYDNQGRLKLMKMFLPGETPRELIRTEFAYANNETIPYKTEVFSAPENKTRAIQ